MILLVGLQVLGEVVDALGESDLDLGRSGGSREFECLRHVGDGLGLRAQIGSHVKSCLSLGVERRPRRRHGAAVRFRDVYRVSATTSDGRASRPRRRCRAQSAGEPENESDLSGVIGETRTRPPGAVDGSIPSQQGIRGEEQRLGIIAVSAPVAAASTAVTAITGM